MHIYVCMYRYCLIGLGKEYALMLASRGAKVVGMCYAVSLHMIECLNPLHCL